MKRILVVILLIELGFANAGEMPRQMLFVNLPDLAQQKLSVSFLNRTKQNNYWQFDAAFRQIYTYSDYFGGYGSGEPHYVKAFSSQMGFHIFAGVGYKFIKSSNTVQSKARYWQPQLVIKMAEEKQIARRVSLFDSPNSYYYNKIYNQYYSAGLELNNGRLRQGKKLMTDMYWGLGFKVNYLQYKTNAYQNYSPDFFYTSNTDFGNSHLSISPYLNLGIKFGKSL